jgi:prolyl oligopeptidase
MSHFWGPLQPLRLAKTGQRPRFNPYHKVIDSTRYPAVLLTTGMNDPRVAPWQPAKMAARLQAATASGKPILLRIDYDAGHGIGSTSEQQVEQHTDMLVFLFWQLRVGEFGSAPASSGPHGSW